MQVTQAESIQGNRVGVEEPRIKLQPLLNIKNMKKFIKSKIDHHDSTNRATPNVSPDPPPPPNSGKQEKTKPEVQPPLPLDPPPPDKPPNLNLNLKKEIEDADYQSHGDESPEALNHKSLEPNFKIDDTDEAEKSKPMCRDFIRGKCTRPGTCKYRHKCDISQLFGVYTFCRNFQNSVCTFTNCKYVHATVFEEQHFYRTGELPPHALAHKKVNMLPPPPPPPEENQTEVLPIFTNPPPPLPVSIEQPIINFIPTSNMEPRSFQDNFSTFMSSASVSSLKREWASLDHFGSSPCDIDTNEQFPKKCKTCDLMEFRFQYNKDKVEKMIQSSEELKKKISQLNKKNDKLYAVLLTLVKPMLSSKANAANGLNISGDKDKSLLEQFNTFLNTNNRGLEDSNKNVLCGNPHLSNLLAKLLCGSGDQTLPSESTRHT